MTGDQHGDLQLQPQCSFARCAYGCHEGGGGLWTAAYKMRPFAASLKAEATRRDAVGSSLDATSSRPTLRVCTRSSLRIQQNNAHTERAANGYASAEIKPSLKPISNPL